jgi:hypothetical protein
MIEMKMEDQNIILKFPKRLMSEEYINRLIERLEVEETASRNQMTEEEAWEISEEIKEKWWNEHKDDFLNRIKKK